MKIKKINTALVGLAVVGSLYLGLRTKSDTVSALSLSSQNIVLPGPSKVSTSGAIRSGSSLKPLEVPLQEADFSPRGKRVKVIPWLNSENEEQFPSQPVLKKWTVGNRTFYQITGPINPDALAKPETTVWGTCLVCEAYFDRGRKEYDQWMIGPSETVFYHWRNGQVEPLRILVSQSTVPKNHFRIDVRGSKATVTFWCDSNDTPTNIVFNYNFPNQRLAWFSTERPTKVHFSHHRQPLWVNP